MNDRQNRFVAAAALLAVLKRAGRTHGEVARHLGVSPTTISQWKLVDSTRKRRIGAPSDVQLIELAALVKDQLCANLDDVNTVLSSGLLRGRLQTHMLYLVLTKLSQTFHDLNDKYEQLRQLHGRIEELAEELGSEVADELRWQFLQTWGEPPDPVPADGMDEPAMLSGEEIIQRLAEVETGVGRWSGAFAKELVELSARVDELLRQDGPDGV